MPGRRRKIKLPNGAEVNAEEMPFKTMGENWNEYLLGDRTVIKLKPVVVSILNLEG